MTCDRCVFLSSSNDFLLCPFSPSQVEGLKSRLTLLDSMDEKLKKIDEFNKAFKAYDQVLHA